MEILITESQLRNLLKEEYSEKIIEQLVAKFMQEDPTEDEDVIRAYIKRFDRIKGDSSILNKDIFSYSLEKLRYVLIDFFKDSKPKSFKGDTDMDVVYNRGNVKIYRADSRNKCITYGKGYSFCISSYSDTASYRKHIIRDKGTPYFILNKNYTNRSNNGFFEKPEHMMVIIAHDGSGIHNDNVGLIKFKDNEELAAYKDAFSLDKFYSVTTAHNMGESYFIKFDNIAKMYPFLEGLESVFEIFPVSEKEDKHLNFETLAKGEMQYFNIKHQKLNFVRDSCGGYLPILRDYNDLRSGEVKDRFLKGEYVKYTLALKDIHGTIISQHTGKDGKAKCMKDMENEIEKNTRKLEELMMIDDKSVQGGKKRNSARMGMNPNYYNILSCEWPNEYISYLKDIFSLGVKLFYKKWAIDNG